MLQKLEVKTPCNLINLRASNQEGEIFTHIDPSIGLRWSPHLTCNLDACQINYRYYSSTLRKSLKSFRFSFSRNFPFTKKKCKLQWLSFHTLSSNYN